MVRNNELPKTIRICGKDYKVKYPKNKPFANIRGIGKHIECNATHNYETSTIKVWYPLYASKDYIMEKIIHECLHGIENAMKIELGEITIKVMACHIQALLKDNPKLLELLK